MRDRSPCLAIIPAKGTSRRLPRKNARLCGGRTLFARAADAARDAQVFEEICIASDSDEILAACGPFGLRRPVILSQDGVTTAMVALYVLSRLDFRFPSFCLLVPTSPLRTPETVRAMWDLFCTSGVPEVMSVRGPDLCATRSPLLHEGTAIFCDTLEFLKQRDFYHHNARYFCVPKNEICDVNTIDDLAKAEEKLAARHT